MCFLGLGRVAPVPSARLLLVSSMGREVLITRCYLLQLPFIVYDDGLGVRSQLKYKYSQDLPIWGNLCDDKPCMITNMYDE